MKRTYAVSLLLVSMNWFGVAVAAKTVGESAAEVSDAGFVRLGFYFPEKVMEGSFAFKDRIDELKRDMEKRSSKLRDARRDLQARQENLTDPNDINSLIQLGKEQSGLQVEGEFLQRHFQMRADQLRAEFIEQDVTEIREELMKELGLDAVLPADKLCSFNVSLDLTEMMVKRLNEKYRAQQQPKKFGMTTNGTKKEPNKK